MEDDNSKKVKRGVFERKRIDDLLAAAKAMPKKSDTKEDLTVGELIPKLWPAIGAMMAKRYSYSEIALWMIEAGVNASKETLVTGIGDEARRRKKKRAGSVATRPDRSRPATRSGNPPAQAQTPPPLNGTGPKPSDEQPQRQQTSEQTTRRTSAAFDDGV